jgi:hypothetical protein
MFTFLTPFHRSVRAAPPRNSSAKRSTLSPLAGLFPLEFQAFVEGVRHRNSDQKHIALSYQRLDHGNLVGDL